MSLTVEQKSHLRITFSMVAEDPVTAASMFYERLFEVAPEVRPMFHSDMAEQGRKLMQTLSIVINGLDKLDEIIPAIRALGERHLQYGVQRQHYALVGETLIWTFATALKDEFTDEVRDAWVAAYTLVADTATAGLYEN